jgi:hypothetical protein
VLDPSFVLVPVLLIVETFIKIKKAFQFNGKLFIGLTTKPEACAPKTTQLILNIFPQKKVFVAENFFLH